MDRREVEHLNRLPEVVELWRDGGGWFLSREAGESAARVRARQVGEAEAVHVFVSRDRIRAVDLDRDSAQVLGTRELVAV